MAGTVSATRCSKAVELIPLRETITFVVARPEISYGTIALIWSALTKSSGARKPSNVTVVLARFMDTMPLVVSVSPTPLVGPILLPNIVMISPGDTLPGWRLAAFTTVVSAGPIGTDLQREFHLARSQPRH